MAEKLRWGLLSTAAINESIIGPLRTARRSELVAVASRDPAKARAYAADKGIGRAYGDYAAMIDDPEIDVIYNPLPNTLHAEWTVAALEAGKHVLCEKPMVIDENALDRMAAAQKKSGKVLFEAVKYLHHPQTWKIMQSLQRGEWGALQMMQGWLHFYLPPNEQENIRLQPQLGGGAYWDLGVYPAGYFISLCGGVAPEEVYAFQHKGESGVDISMNVQMCFSTGAVAQLSCSFRTPRREGLYIVCDNATAHVPAPFGAGEDNKESEFTVTGLEHAQVQHIKTEARNPFLGEVEQMEACALDGAPPLVPMELSRAFLRTALAVYASAATKQPVRIKPHSA